ncbi:MAG: HEAT repeat domain-containing protein, partial [Planctomycetaceae bacterium]|nr:HEAT repeat domain-containing protein [Planctomycetaceae bacterium]
MRACWVLVLGLLLPAAAQDAPDLLQSCEALYEPLTSLQLEGRSRAQAELVKLTAGKRDFFKQPVLPSPQIVLALVGDKDATREVAKVIGEDGPLLRIAVEAIGHAGPDVAAERLFKLLDHEDLRLAMSAARSLSKIKNPANVQTLQQQAEQVDNPRRKVLATYALGGPLTTIFNQAESSAAPVREAAWVALANLPAAGDELRGRLFEKDGEQKWRGLFENPIASAEVRDVFGRLLVRAGLYVGPDLVDLGTHKSKEVAAWARAAVGDPLLMRKSVLIGSALKRLQAFENETDLGKDPIPWLESLLAAQGIKGEGEKVKERLESARSAWERTRPSVLEKDINAAIDAGVALLRSRQDGAGYWKFCTCGLQKNDAHNNGTTALAVYTLLKCDVPVRDKAVVTGLDWLLAQPLPNHTYTVGLQAMAFGDAMEMLTPPPKSKVKIPPADLEALNKYLPRLRDCVTWLVEAQTRVNRGGYESGDWDYVKPAGNGMDNSNTQFAVL